MGGTELKPRLVGKSFGTRALYIAPCLGRIIKNVMGGGGGGEEIGKSHVA